MITPDGTSLDNTVQPHSILQLTLESDETYAIDITGIQYGFPDDEDAVIPWDIYRNSRIQSVRQIEILQSLADERLEDERLAEEQAQIEDEEMEFDEADALSSSSEEEYSFTGHVIEAIKSWQQTNPSLQHILFGGRPWEFEGLYLIKQEEMVDFIERQVNGVNSN